MHSRISRRTVLRGIGAAVSLPMLEIMTPAISSAAQPNKRTPRICYLYFPNGSAEGSWAPEKVSDEGKLIQLNRWMSPLEPLREEIIIPRSVWTPRGNGHGAGTATWLTGSGYDGQKINAGGISADQLAAQQVGGETLLPSLELSMRGEGYFSIACLATVFLGRPPQHRFREKWSREWFRSNVSHKHRRSIGSVCSRSNTR